MDAGATLRLLLGAQTLKRVPRMGWAMRGVGGAESVADHSYGVTLIALVLAELADQPLDTAKLLTIALLHDLPESVIGDIPTPAATHLPPKAKRQAEMRVLGQLLDRWPCAEQWLAWWQEFEDGTSVEGRLVRDADRLDMLIQAYVYEQTTGNRLLDEFWPSPEAKAQPFEFPASQELYVSLKALRDRSP